MSSELDEKQLLEDLQIDPDDISQAMITQPSLRVHYARIAYEKMEQYERHKEFSGVLEASLYKKYRKELIDSGEKPTEKLITAFVESDDQLRKARLKVINLRKEAQVAREIVNSFDHKRDMLVQVAKSQLRELLGSGGLSVTHKGMEEKLKNIA